MAIKFYSKVEQGWIINSEIKPFQFPGGEWSLKLPSSETPYLARVTNTQSLSDDLILLSLWTDWCHELGMEALVQMPYLPAARADRGTPFGGKIYANLLNSMNLDEIVLFDPHSPIVPQFVNNAKIVEPARIIKNAVFGKSGYSTYTGIICPDEGAVERAQAVANLVRLPLYKAEKKRDFETGKILDYLPGEVANAPKDGRYLVVDDICDGGGTFKFLAETIDIPRNQLSLWVSHGIFSGSAHELNEYYGSIYTTDSVVPLNDIGAKTFTVFPYLTSTYFSSKGQKK